MPCNLCIKILVFTLLVVGKDMVVTVAVPAAVVVVRTAVLVVRTAVIVVRAKDEPVCLG